jgi:L-gulono-1,4-lactone dehydrogenase
MGHHYFRHEEMEMFVSESRLQEAVDVLRCATEVFAGQDKPVPSEIEAKLRALGLYDELLRNRGTYTQHYPFFFRRLLPEDTLISMASSAEEPFYSVSVFTYYKPGNRKEYYTFCSWLARCMTSLAGARLHWGKHFPLGAAEMARLYPHLETFKQVCRNTDPGGVFRNDYTERVLGLPAVRLEGRHGRPLDGRG